MTYSTGPRRRLWPRVLVALLIVLLLGTVAVAGYARSAYTTGLQPVSDMQQNKLFTVEKGATASEVATALKDEGLIRSTWVFEWYLRAKNLRGQLQAGTYYLSPSQSVQDIAAVLTKGKVASELVTILPAQRLDQIERSLVNAGFSPGAVRAALEPAQYESHPALASKPKGASLEGYIYPESFQKTSETTPEDIIRRSLDLMAEQLTADVTAGFSAQGLSVHQGVILASIVEEEVSRPDDKPTVAQVLLRRFKEATLLGSDPTAFYGAILDGQEPTVGYDSPYNTRKYAGLPPGPISNTSLTSLRAVAFPADTDYFYFVAGDDGTTHFSKTLAEHEALTRQYCTKLCQ